MSNVYVEILTNFILLNFLRESFAIFDGDLLLNFSVNTDLW